MILWAKNLHIVEVGTYPYREEFMLVTQHEHFVLLVEACISLVGLRHVCIVV